MQKQQKTDLERYYNLKAHSQLPLKLKLYFSILENGLEHHHKSSKLLGKKKQFSKALVHAFNNMSPPEKGKYLYESLNFVLEEMDRLEKDKTKAQSRLHKDAIQNIETTCQVLFSALKFHYWSTFHMKIDKQKRMIHMMNKKKKFSIDIRQYFVRRSKKYKAAIVMQTLTEEANNEAKKYVINLSSSIVLRIYEEIFKCVMICQGEKLISLLQEEEDDDESQSHHSSQYGTNTKALVILSPTNINQYLQYKQKILKQCLTHNYDFKAVHKEPMIVIQRSQKTENVYKMESLIENYEKNIKQDFINALYNKNKYIVSTQILESFSKKYKAVYEKYSFHSKVQEMISIREENVSNNQEEVLFVRTVENIMSVNYLEFLHVKIRHISPTQMKMIVFICVNEKHKRVLVTQDVVIKYLVELRQMIFKPDKNVPLQTLLQSEASRTTVKNYFKQAEQNIDEDEIDDEDEFKTVKGDSEEFIEFVEGDEADPTFAEIEQSSTIKEEGHKNNLVLLNSNRPFEKMEEMQDFHNSWEPNKDFIYEKYLLTPYPKGVHEKKKLLEEHYLFSEWVRCKAGGVVCTNLDKITVQKNLFKYGLVKYGKNLLKGQILRISLPIQIFRKESHLQTLSRNMSYAPLFFQKLANMPIREKEQPKIALERVKYSTLLAISVGTVGILMDKPFNPILGQTLQEWIDGCPMYVQQISHHPPISSYYFKGRGYDLHGTVEPKMSFGMNYIKGYSARPNYITFYKFREVIDPEKEAEIDTQIQINFGKMIIKGTLFGQREFNFEQKMYAMDRKNQLFSEIFYGPKKKHMPKKKSNLPSDYIFGSIYQVSKKFIEEFLKSEPRIYPQKTDILQTLSTFEGFWNDEVKFDNVTYINFRTDLPCQILPEKVPLPSNSCYRSDLQRLIEDNLPEAQKQKDRMEDVQRRDRKLRDQYRHHHQHQK